MRFIDSNQIALAATISEWVNAMEQAMVASLRKGFLMPQRMHLDRSDDTFLLMPCITNEYWMTKLVSFNPSNRDNGLPSIHGTIVLSRTKTGEPLAVMDGSIITAFRTAAVSGLGIKYLAPQNVVKLGIVGTGAQSIYQARFACNVRKIKNITIYDISENSIAGFLSAFEPEFPDIGISVASNSEEVCLSSDVIITATNSKFPVFPGRAELFNGKTFIGIGSYKPDFREYPDVIFSLIDEVFVDTLHADKETGDLIYPIMNNLISEDNIHSLGSLISGEVSPPSNCTRFFKTVGSALFDLYAARLLYEKSTDI